MNKVRSQRHGRRRVIDLICTAVDADPHAPTEDEPGVADQSAREWSPAASESDPRNRSQGG